MASSPEPAVVDLHQHQDKEKQLLESFVREEEPTTYSPFFRQTLAAVGPVTNVIANGIVTGYTAILLPQLTEESSTIKVTKEQESWIASMAPLPMALGCLFGGWFMESVGRKRAMIISSIFIIIGWCFIYLATSFTEILVGRLISGYFVGVSFPICSIYLGENSEPKYRGFFMSMIGSAVAFAFFTCHLIGTFLDWQTTTLIVMIFPLIVILSLLPVPETYVWYLNRNDIQRAKESFYWLRGRNPASIDELNAIFLAHSKLKKRTAHEVFKECLKPQFLKPLSIMGIYFITVQFSGCYVIAFYTVMIMEGTVPNVDKYTAMLIVDAIRVVVSVIACALIKKIRVRPLTIFSGIGTAISLYSLATFVYLTKTNHDNVFVTTMPLISFISFIFFTCIGFVPLVWMLCGELYPPTTKGVGGGISSTINFLGLFVTVKTIPDLFDAIGPSGTFGTYATFASVGTVILYFVLPETRGRTLKEIEQYFVS